MLRSDQQAPLIAHLVHRLDVGGMENGLINLINHLPAQRYRHAIICLRDQTDFAARLRRSDVEIICLNKREGKDWRHYFQLYSTLRRLQPALIHTRNLSTIEAQLLAACAGVRVRVHSEHGRDSRDLYGKNPRYRLIRRLLRPLIGHYITVSRELESWLVHSIGAAPARVSHICNGVDTTLYHPRLAGPTALGPAGFMNRHCFVFGSIGRMVDNKDHGTLVRAFISLIAEHGMLRERLRLMIIGEGPCRSACVELLQQAGMADLAWLPGQRDDIPVLLRAMDAFVLPSLSEGMSNTILEAMSTGLPVIATSVGANAELLDQGWNGTLVTPHKPAALARAMAQYFHFPALATLHGRRGRRRALEHYSMGSMANAYLALYDRLSAGPQG